MTEHLVFQHFSEALHAQLLLADMMLTSHHHFLYATVLLHPILFCSGRAHTKHFLLHIEYKVLKYNSKHLFLDTTVSGGLTKEQSINVSGISNLGFVCLFFVCEEDGKLTTTVSSGE